MKSQTILFTCKAERKLLLHWSKKHEDKLMHDLFSQGSPRVRIKYLEEVLSLNSLCWTCKITLLAYISSI